MTSASSASEPKAIAAIRAMLRSLPVQSQDGLLSNPAYTPGALNKALEGWEQLDRYQAVAVAASMVVWVASEREMTADAVLDAYVQENWPSS